MHEQAAQQDAQLAAEPKPALAVMIAVAGVAIVGNAVATALGISFDNAIWLMIGMLVLVGVVAARIAKRQRALGAQLNDKLVQEMLLVNLRTTGRSNVRTFEAAAWYFALGERSRIVLRVPGDRHCALGRIALARTGQRRDVTDRARHGLVVRAGF